MQVGRNVRRRRPAAFSLLCLLAFLAVVLPACRRTEPPPAPHPPQTSGTLQVPGLQAPVTVVRDAWGIPHITAGSADDLFFAQGFVQAEDRLFQMDLWKRSVQGRLSEVLGANFIQRDSMTRRIQFRGDLDREWGSYGPDTRRIAVAFTNGINAWVRIARQDPPEEFVLAGWEPEFWRPEDLLNRTDAFLASGNALDELFRARLVAALGAPRADQLFPLPGRQRSLVATAVDLSSITFVVSDAVRRIGTPPFFLTLAGKASEAPRSSQESHDVRPKSDNATDVRSALLQPGLTASGRIWLVDAAQTNTGAPLLAVSSNAPFSAPSSRYLVHLTAPGWNVIGATSPWLPGVVIGHNNQVAWAMTPKPVDTQDVFVERVNPNDSHQVERDGHWVEMAVDHERIEVKGRDRPVQYERQYTRNGVVIAQDRERNLVYTLRWSGAEPGAAGELAALALNRASSASEFVGALSHWKMPVAEFVFADNQGQTGKRLAGFVPVRVDGAGNLPGAGWTSSTAWKGYDSQVRPAETMTIGASSMDDLKRVQADVSSPGARTLLALVDQLRSQPGEVEAVRASLLAWDGRFDGRRLQEDLYIRFEGALRQQLARMAGVPDDLVSDLAERLDPVAVLAGSARGWFPDNGGQRRQQVLVQALSVLAKEAGQVGRAGQAGQVGQGGLRTMTFEHPLAVFEPSKRRFNVGPFGLLGSTDTIFATDGRRGSVFKAVFDLRDWSRSVAMNAPGQSGSPSSPHYDDLGSQWSAGAYVNLLFDQGSINASAADTLTLVPKIAKSSDR